MASKETKLSILVEARNNAEAALGRVKGNLDAISKSNENIISGMKTVGKVGAAAFAGLSVGIGYAVSQGIESNKILAQLDAVLTSTAGKAKVTREAAIDLANSLSKVTLFTDDAVLSAQNMLLTFTNIGSDVFPNATETVLNMSQALGQDLKSSAVQLGKALNDPIDGITALSRVGVTFTDAQKQMIEAMVESGDIMGAQKVILQELNTEFGNSARAAAEADPFAMMKKSVDEMAESLGKSLIPIMQPFIERISDVVTRVSEWMEKNPQLTAQLTIAAFVIAGLVASMWILGSILPGLAATFTFFSAVIAGTAAPAAIIAVLLGIIIATIIIIMVQIKNLKGNWDDVWLGMKLRFAEFANFFVKIAEFIVNYFIDRINNLIQTVNSLLDKLAALPLIGKQFEKLKIKEIAHVEFGGIDTSQMVDKAIQKDMQQQQQNNSIEMSNNVFLSEDVAEQIGDMIMDKLKLSSNV